MKRSKKNNQTNKRIFGHFKLSNSKHIEIHQPSRSAGSRMRVDWPGSPWTLPTLGNHIFVKVPQWKIAETGKK
jgi:hypothetical protein